MPSALSLVHEARKCIGTPYQHLGRLPGVGLDCIGLILAASKAAGFSHQGFQDYPYGPVPNGHFKHSLDRYMDCIWDKDAPGMGFQALLQGGDVLSLTWRIRPMHCAMVAVGPYGWNMIHAFSGNAEVVEHRIDQVWQARVCQVYRLKDVI